MFWTGPLKAVGLIGPFVIGLVMKQNSITTLIAMMSASTYLINPLTTNSGGYCKYSIKSSDKR